jgi:hypothetical protein
MGRVVAQEQSIDTESWKRDVESFILCSRPLPVVELCHAAPFPRLLVNQGRADAAPIFSPLIVLSETLVLVFEVDNGESKWDCLVLDVYTSAVN